RGNRSEQLDIGVNDVANEPRTSHQQTERDADAGGKRIADGDAPEARGDMQIERGLLEMADQRLSDLQRPRDVVESDIEVEAGGAGIVPKSEPGEERRETHGPARQRRC